MNTRHYFLTGPQANVPARWTQAFPQGQGMPGAQALLELRGSAAHSTPALAMPAHVVWVPAALEDWATWLARLSIEAPACHGVVMSSALDDKEALQALQAGAKGYVHLHATSSLLREVSLVVEHGGLWPGAGLVARFLAATTNLLQRSETPERGDISMLSAREEQVAKAVASGLANKEVAARLDISERTVKAHLGAAFEKLGVRDRLQLVLYLSAGPGAASRASGKGKDHA